MSERLDSASAAESPPTVVVKCCGGVVDRAFVIVAARHMDVCRGGMQGGGDFDMAQRVTGPHHA